MGISHQRFFLPSGSLGSWLSPRSGAAPPPADDCVAVVSYQSSVFSLQLSRSSSGGAAASARRGFFWCNWAQLGATFAIDPRFWGREGGMACAGATRPSGESSRTVEQVNTVAALLFKAPLELLSVPHFPD